MWGRLHVSSKYKEGRWRFINTLHPSLASSSFLSSALFPRPPRGQVYIPPQLLTCLNQELNAWDGQYAYFYPSPGNSSHAAIVAMPGMIPGLNFTWSP